MKKNYPFYLFKFSIHVLVIILFVGCNGKSKYNEEPVITGELKKWHTVTISFNGPEVDESDAYNPFLNYRLNVTFNNQEKTYIIPGFFADDGNASETGATGGNIWQVRFTPDKTGDWTYKASFRKGKNIAINDTANAGSPLFFDGITGSFKIEPTDKKGNDLRSKGKLRYDGTHYLKFAETGEPFLKGGADSPENFLAYYEFDQTIPTHYYKPHSNDWEEGDPVWHGKRGKNIIGALNYLSSEGMNSVYFLTMNVMGDGKDVWPWTDKNERYRFDCSKLDQWEIVFSHMDKVGIMKHFVTQETENELLLDIGYLGAQRKLYYRELIARFSHHLAITWNLGEENGAADWTPLGQQLDQRKKMASYIKKLDPYNNFVAMHTHSSDPVRSKLLDPLAGLDYIDGPSLQIDDPFDVHRETIKRLRQSEDSGKFWVVCLDEIGPYHTGVKPDADDKMHDTIRKKVLWGNLMAGGAGVEWYFGYKYPHGDLDCEDWRSRDNMWDQTQIALNFFKEYIPFCDMHSADGLTISNDDYCFAKAGEVYAVYLPEGGTTSLLLKHEGDYSVKWYNPRKGGDLLNGTIKKIKGPGEISIGYPPDKKTDDWVSLIKIISN